ncbi:MAG: S8 family peptidase [Bacteroidota bacterium]
MVYATLDAANRDFGTEAARIDFPVTGEGIGICVVDTGVDPDHEQLDNGKVIGFEDFIGTGTIAYDDHGHGTHVSSIAAGDGIGGSNASKYKGVAPEVEIYAAKVLDSSGSGPNDGVISGVQWCASQEGVDIISMSLGIAGSSDGQDALSLTVNNAVSAGKTVVVAAGNSGSGTYTVGSPGAASEAITVGAVAEWSAPEGSPNHSEGVYLASFSSRGPTEDDRTKPDIVAPGVSITAAKSGSTDIYVAYSGTSMATPFVSGTVALALEAGETNGLIPAEVKQKIMSTAKDCGPTGLDNDWGAGLIDGYALVSEIMGTPASNSYPTFEHIGGSVSDNGSWQFSFDVHDPSVPVAVMMTIECGLDLCPYDDPFLCAIWALGQSGCSPDLDMELWGPSGFLAESTCMVGDECAGNGRQETIHFMPTNVGTYTIRVYPYEGDPNNGMGGNFTIDISTGPVDSGCSDDDSDCDGVSDGEDGCPNDSNKTDPGVCGCGTPDTDSDGDGTPDCFDNCDEDPLKTEPGVCGCGVADTDTDGDGTPDCFDNCYEDPLKTEPGVCGCGVVDTEGCNDCTACFKGECDGVCHPKEVGISCPDCSSTPSDCSPKNTPCKIDDECCSGKCHPVKSTCT